MNTPTEQLIQQAVTEARAGNKANARAILSRVVKQEPGNARAWYLLSQAVEKQEQAIYCLEQILKIQPDNSQVKERLNRIELEQKMPARAEPSLQRAEEQQKKAEPDSANWGQEPDKQHKPKKQSKFWTIVFVVIVGVICTCLSLALIGQGGGDGGGGILVSGYTVTYRIEGTASGALITYSNDQGGTEQLNVALPWSKSYKMERGDFASLVAQSDSYGQSIACIIEVNGKELKRSTSSGDFVVVTCNAWLGIDE